MQTKAKNGKTGKTSNALSPHQAARAEGLALRNKAYEYLTSHPGVTAEAIGTDLHVSNREMLSRMLAWLKAGGYVRGKGATRNMVYSVTKKKYQP